MKRRVALVINVVQRRVVAILFDVLEQEFEQREILVAACHVNRIASVRVREGQVSVGLEKELANLDFVELTRDQKRCELFGVLQIDKVLIGNGLGYVDEELEKVKVAVDDAQVNRCVALLILYVLSSRLKHNKASNLLFFKQN